MHTAYKNLPVTIMSSYAGPVRIHKATSILVIFVHPFANSCSQSAARQKFANYSYQCGCLEHNVTEQDGMTTFLR